MVRSHLVQGFSSSLINENHLHGVGGGGMAGEILIEIQIPRLHPDLLNQNLQGEDVGNPIFNKHPRRFLSISKFGKH